MKKIIFLILIGLTLSGCSILRPHKQDITQGNMITTENVSRLRTGMSEGQVKDLMGHPLLVNIFNNDRIDYVFTFQGGHGDIKIKRVICSFQGGRLVDIQRSDA